MSELRQTLHTLQKRRIEYCNLDILCHPRPIEHFKMFFPNYKLIAVKEPSYSYNQIDSQLNSPEWQVEFGTSPIIDCENKEWEELVLDIVLCNTTNWVILINDTYTEFKKFRRYILTLE